MVSQGSDHVHIQNLVFVQGPVFIIHDLPPVYKRGLPGVYLQEAFIRGNTLMVHTTDNPPDSIFVTLYNGFTVHYVCLTGSTVGEHLSSSVSA